MGFEGLTCGCQWVMGWEVTPVRRVEQKPTDNEERKRNTLKWWGGWTKRQRERSVAIAPNRKLWAKWAVHEDIFRKIFKHCVNLYATLILLLPTGQQSMSKSKICGGLWRYVGWGTKHSTGRQSSPSATKKQPEDLSRINTTMYVSSSKMQSPVSHGSTGLEDSYPGVGKKISKGLEIFPGQTRSQRHVTAVIL